MRFELEFNEWIDNSLHTDLPNNLRAFAFNLFELAASPENSDKFGVEFIGSSSFSKLDPDWACDEIFEGSPRNIRIPISYSGSSWEDCLDAMTKLANTYIKSNASGALKLKAAEGVGIGFVDGDLHLLTE